MRISAAVAVAVAVVASSLNLVVKIAILLGFKKGMFEDRIGYGNVRYHFIYH